MSTVSRVRACIRAAGPYRPRIEAMLRQFPDQVEFVKAPDPLGAPTPEDLVPADLMFLDIDVSGLDLPGLARRARELNREARIVLISGQETDPEPYLEAGADELLGAAFSSARLAELVVSAITGRGGDESAGPVPHTSAAPEVSASFPRRLVIRSGTRWVVVDSSRLLRVEADGNYAVLVCDDGEHIRVRSTLSAIFSHLDPRQFFRVHRSMIVRLDQVTEIFNTAQGDYHVKLAGGVEATVTRSRRADFVAALEGAGAFGSID